MSTDPRRTEIATNIVPDVPDRRDLFWEPADESVEAPDRVDPDGYQRLVGVTWHQRCKECTGFALAAIANYRTAATTTTPPYRPSARRMLYESAQLPRQRRVRGRLNAARRSPRVAA